MKVKARHQKVWEDLDAAKNLMEETEQALVRTKAREAKPSRAVEGSQVEVNVAENQASIASACVLSFENARQRMMALSEEEIKAEAHERLHQDKAGNVKELEDQIKKLGHFQY